MSFVLVFRFVPQEQRQGNRTDAERADTEEEHELFSGHFSSRGRVVSTRSTATMIEISIRLKPYTAGDR